MELKIVVPFGNTKQNFEIGKEYTDKKLGKKLFDSLLSSEMAVGNCDESKALAEILVSERKDLAKKLAEAKAKSKAVVRVVDTDVTGLKAQLKTSKGETATVAKALTKIQGELNTYKESDKREVSDLEGKVKSLTLELASVRGELNTEVAQLKSELKALKEENEALKAMG